MAGAFPTKMKSPFPTVNPRQYIDYTQMDMFVKYASHAADNVSSAFVRSFQTIEYALTDMVMGAKLNLRDLARSVAAEFAQVFIRTQMIAPAASMVGGALGLTTTESGGQGMSSLFNSMSREAARNS